MNDKKIIVTGGLGFIGSNLVERLIAQNEVTIIDDQSTGKLDNVNHLKQDNLNIINGSITDLNLTEIFEDQDYVFHQAALPSVPRSVKDPISSNEANITGTLKVLTAAKDSGVKKVICASSSSVYGDTPTLPKSEDMPVNPLSPYAVTKVTGEFYCKVFQDIYGLRTASLRYFNVFGPRQDPSSQYAAVIPKFIYAIQNNEPPIIYGDGEQSRDFSYIRHVVDANILACESDKTGIFNIACGRRITINKLVDMINEILGKDIEPVYAEPRPGDIKHSLADISRARTFGYDPESDLKEELRETIRWFTLEISERLNDRSAVVCVVGVGYVGLPLAEAFSNHLKVIGYDLSEMKVEDLNHKNNNNNLIFTSDPAEIKKADFILIAVPTPVTESKEPDLFCVRSSVETVGRNLKKGAVVVLESTVYPGVTEEIVMPLLEKSSGMNCGVDFKIGYSPERINPGDEAHRISNITKIVSGMDEETTEVLAELYDLITTVFKARDIRTAEAAKVIENIQRDLNIALMNELALIFERMDIDIMDVIEAAATKWNFNVYYPGAGVGGHCLPVDPYYLVTKAEELGGYHSKVITAGRAVNDYMPLHVFELLVDALNECERAVTVADITGGGGWGLEK